MTVEQVFSLVREGYNDRIDPRVVAFILLQWETHLWHETVQEKKLPTVALSITDESTEARIGQ